MNNENIFPFLWFDTQAEEAANFYVSVFGGDSKILDIARYPEGSPSPAKPGSVMTVSFVIRGQKFIALNGGPVFKFNEAVSFMVTCDDQADIDRCWKMLSSDGGQEIECGWVKDKYGLAWQIVPKVWNEFMASDDAAAKERMLKALWTMKKLNIAALTKAFEGK